MTWGDDHLRLTIGAATAPAEEASHKELGSSVSGIGQDSRWE